MNYKGTIIEESLSDKSILKNIKILDTRVEIVSERHKTPWLKKWTLHLVEIPEKDAGRLAEVLSSSIDMKHSGAWYIDYKNEKWHYIIFPNKIFKIDRKKPDYRKAKSYGIGLGIPEYQVDFSPDIP